MITQESIERVKNEANLVEVVSETVQLRRAGVYFSGLCPFHSEKSPSFFVRESSNSYTCFGCGASGNVISFVMATRAMTFPDAVEYLASRFRIEIKRDKMKVGRGPTVDREKLFAISRTAYLFFRQSLNRAKEGQGEFKKVGDYLRSRGLTAAAINEFGIGYAPTQRGALLAALKREKYEDESILLTGLVRRSASGELYEMFRGRLIFPIFVDSTRIAAFGGRLIPGLQEASYEAQSPKYLNSPESPLYQKSKTIYGLPQAMEGIRHTKESYVVEGYMDVVGLWMAGVRNAVACCGTAMTEQHIKRFTGLCSRVHLLFDGDSAGRTAASKAFLVSRNAPLDLSVCFLPEGIDPDDLARQSGEECAQALKALPRAELVDVYIDGLLQRHGLSPDEKPGVNLRGALCEEVAKALSVVESEVVLTALVGRASRQLGVDVQQLLRLIEVRESKESSRDSSRDPSRETREFRELKMRGDVKNEGLDEGAQLAGSNGAGEGSSVGHSPSEESGLTPRAVTELPKVDQEILRAVMVLKSEIVLELLRDPGTCEGLHPDTVRFATELYETLAGHPDDEDQQKAATRALLQSFGPSWIELWREAYLRVKGGVEMREVYRWSVKAISMERLQRLDNECEREIAAAHGDEEEQLRASSRRVGIQARIQAERNGGR